MLVKSYLGSLLSYFGFQDRSFLSRVERGGISIGLQISVLTSSMFNTVNLFTNGDQGTLFTSCTRQNSSLEQSKFPFPLLYPSGPSSLQLVLPFVLQLTFRRLSGRGSPSQDSWPLCTDSILVEVKSVFSGLRLHLWV